MTTISERLIPYTYYKKLLKTNKKKELLDKTGVLGEGEQGKVYLYRPKNKDDMMSIAIKKIYLDQTQSKYIDDIFNKKAFKFGVFIELSCYYLINELVLQKISPNFILNYDFSFTKRNGICSDIYPYTGYFYNEYIEKSQTYSEWVKKEHNLNEWYNAYFQITSAIYVLQSYFDMTHLDLHADNILVRKVKAGGYWSYIINGNTYKVQNLGYIFYINDFGHAFIPNVFTSWFATKKYKNSIHKGFDIYQLFKSTLKFTTSPKEFKSNIKYIIKKLKSNSDFNLIIEEIWGSRYINNNKKTTKNLETYNLDKNLSVKKIPQELKQLYIK